MGHEAIRRTASHFTPAMALYEAGGEGVFITISQIGKSRLGVAADKGWGWG